VQILATLSPQKKKTGTLFSSRYLVFIFQKWQKNREILDFEEIICE
jgi:hypothetical protein